jgi:hypothetical protein
MVFIWISTSSSPNLFSLWERDFSLSIQKSWERRLIYNLPFDVILVRHFTLAFLEKNSKPCHDKVLAI